MVIKSFIILVIRCLAADASVTHKNNGRIVIYRTAVIKKLVRRRKCIRDRRLGIVFVCVLCRLTGCSNCLLSLIFCRLLCDIGERKNNLYLVFSVTVIVLRKRCRLAAVIYTKCNDGKSRVLSRKHINKHLSCAVTHIVRIRTLHCSGFVKYKNKVLCCLIGNACIPIDIRCNRFRCLLSRRGHPRCAAERHDTDAKKHDGFGQFSELLRMKHHVFLSQFSKKS